jgi:hypothetical protein
MSDQLEVVERIRGHVPEGWTLFIRHYPDYAAYYISCTISNAHISIWVYADVFAVELWYHGRFIYHVPSATHRTPGYIREINLLLIQYASAPLV